jgi:chromosome segregation ATPase
VAALHNDLESTVSQGNAVAEDLKETIEHLGGKLQELRTMRNEVEKDLVSLGQEKARFAEVEKELERVTDLSLDVGERLKDFRNLRDDVQQLDTRLTTMKETADDTATRFMRLEKKKEVLDKIILDVDESFDKIQSLQDRIKLIDGETHGLPDKIAVMQKAVNDLLSTRERVADTMRKVEGLSKSVDEASAKKDELRLSKDFYTSLEVRLQQLARDAESQINLFKTLADTRGSSGRSSGNITIPPSTRDDVAKLKQMGWKPEQIAQNLKLSLAEVELLLEMAH